MRYSFDADGPTEKKVQYYEMMGTRALWHEGWHVVAQRAPQQGAQRGRLRQRHLGALPLRGGPLRGPRPGRRAPRQGQGAGQPLVRRGRQVRRAPARQPVHRGAVQGDAGGRHPRGRHLPLLPADLARPGVQRGGDPGTLVQDPGDRSSITDADAQGVLLANGARFGGHTLFLKDRRLWYANNFLGIPPEQQLVSPDELAVGHARARAWSSRRRATATTARPSARRPCTSTTSPSPRASGRPSPATSRCAVRA